MSSRALRKLLREQELVLSKSTNQKELASTNQGSHGGTAIGCEKKVASDDLGSDNENEEQPPGPEMINNKKKKTTRKAAPANPFALLNEDMSSPADADDKEGTNENTDDERTEDQSAATTNRKAKKSKKSKKKHKEKEVKVETSDADHGVNWSELCSGETVPVQQRAVNTTGAGKSYADNSKPILAIEHRCLDPDNEVKRIFGGSVIQRDQRSHQRNHRHHRSAWLVNPRDNWPHSRKTGLSMKLIESKNGLQYFTFVHSRSYQKIQFQFLDAVESLNPQNIIDLLNINPFHIDTLLQVSEIFKINEEWQTASQMIERALHVFESSFHPTFSLTHGTSRLDYRYPENRSFYLALFHHLVFVGRKGCYRTSLEFCKLILSLDPDNDPLCMLLLVDFYAIRSEQYAFLIRLANEWEAPRSLSLLPNFAFSVPLAIFHQANVEHSDLTEADRHIQQSLLMFPGVLNPLLEKCGVNPDPYVAKHSFFKSTTQESDGLTRLIQLYVGRNYFCWKEADVMPWLERNVRTVLDRVDRGEPLVEEYAKKRSVRYQGMPRNIYRHIVLSDIKEATIRLPYELTSSPVLSYDPLPPVDTVVSYERPLRTRRAQEPVNALTMFIRSLVPSFDPQEVVAESADDDAGGAIGGVPREGLEVRQSINSVMTAMRAMFNRIQFVPPPVENDQHRDDEDDEDAFDEEGNDSDDEDEHAA